MKKIILSAIIMLISASSGYGQLIEDRELNGVNKSTNNLILGIFNPKNFTMQHSFQVSMLNSSYGSISTTSYVNSMMYKFNENLSVQADVKLQYSPFASSIRGKEFASQLQKDFTGLNLSRLALNYKISSNSFIRFEYRNLTNEYYDSFYPYSKTDY